MYKFFKILYVAAIIKMVISPFSLMGRSGYQFLSIAPSARGAALDGSLNAGVINIESLQYNPSGLYFSNKRSFLISYVNWIFDIKYSYVGYSDKISIKRKKYGIGVSLQYVDEGYVIQDGIDNSINDFSVQFGIAGKLKKFVVAGFSVKYAQRNLFNNYTMALLFDAGLQFKFKTWKKFIFGITINNTGYSGKIIANSDDTPSYISAGVMYYCNINRISSKVRLFFNYLDYFYDYERLLCTGLEFVHNDKIFLRFGRRFFQSDFNYAGEQELILGGGIKFDLNKINYNIEFAVVPYLELGTGYYTTFKVLF